MNYPINPMMFQNAQPQVIYSQNSRPQNQNDDMMMMLMMMLMSDKKSSDNDKTSFDSTIKEYIEKYIENLFSSRKQSFLGEKKIIESKDLTKDSKEQDTKPVSVVVSGFGSKKNRSKKSIKKRRSKKLNIRIV